MTKHKSLKGNAFSFRQFLKENIIFIIIAFITFTTDPAIVRAQNAQKAEAPVPFTGQLALTRGNLSPDSANKSAYLKKDLYCRVVKEAYGWSSCEGIDAFIVKHIGGMDTTIVSKPNSEGYVKLDDWESADRDESIKQIEEQLREGLKQQGQRLGAAVTFKGWRTYPTLNKDKKYMYYATDIVWNGEVNTNVKATVFDRRGYVAFNMVPEKTDLTSKQIEQLINSTLDLYKPKQEERYASFTSGDKVAAVGALGVLATLAGVKWGKAAASGLLAILLVLLKKFWFVLIFPFMLIGKLFKRSE